MSESGLKHLAREVSEQLQRVKKERNSWHRDANEGLDNLATAVYMLADMVLEMAGYIGCSVCRALPGEDCPDWCIGDDPAD